MKKEYLDNMYSLPSTLMQIASFTMCILWSIFISNIIFKLDHVKKELTTNLDKIKTFFD